MSVANERLATRRARRMPTSAAVSKAALYGLFIFTFFLVTARFSPLFTEFGIYLALLALLAHPQGVRFPAPARWATALVLWGVVTTFFAISPEKAYETLIELLKALVVFFVVMNALQTSQQLRSYILLFLVAFVIWPARGTLQNYVTGNTLVGRAIWNGIYANPNDLAAITLLVLGLTLAIATVKTQNERVRRAAIAFVPVTVLIILLTQSRGVFIGLLLGLGPTVLSRMRRRPTVVGPVLIVVLLAGLLVPSAAWHRLESITSITSSKHVPEADKYAAFASNSAAERIKILKVGWHIFTDHPLLGVGLGCYNEANAHYAPTLGWRDAHSTYITLAAEMGLPGLLLWLGLVGSVLLRVRRRRRSIEADDRTIQIVWLERAIVGFLVAAFFASYAAITIFYLLLGTLWAASNALGRDAPEPAAPRGPRALPAR